MTNHYDIFISYKRKSLPTANNLYYRLTTRGYSTFFDLEEMGRDNFNVQLLNYIENAKDVFVILEEGSLDGCKQGNWEDKDWFCHEIAFALEKKKNIIPILLNGYQMPSQDFFPDDLKELGLKNAPEFNFSFFEAYLDKLIEKEYLLSKPNVQDKATSVFKFYSNENCQVFKEGKLVCILEGMSDEPYYLPVPRKGDYRFKAVNLITADKQTIKERIEADEEKEIEIEWERHLPLKPDQEWPEQISITGENYLVDLGYAKFNMIRVEGGEMIIGATQEQETDAEANEYPAHKVNIKTFYIGQFPITQNIWEIVMGYNKSHFRDREKQLVSDANGRLLLDNGGAVAGAVIGTMVEPIGGMSSAIGSLPLWTIAKIGSKVGAQWLKEKIKKFVPLDSCEIGHYPVENVSYDDAQEFVRRLSKITNIAFSLPTEDEWEYAARGGQKSQNYKYAGSDDLSEVAWYRDNAEGATHPVGEKAPNEIGLYDMSGNVWEWTETQAHFYASNVEPGGTIFIRRGGSWWHGAKNCRVSRRYASDHSKETSGLGLRVVIRKNVESTIKKDEVYDVFISYYRNTGLQLAKSIHQLLTKEGYTVFFNEDSVREGLVDENILIHVKRCRDFILIIDTQFAKKMFCQENDWVNTELSEAIKRGNGIVNIIPILLQPDLSLSNDIFINYDKLFFQEPITVFDLIGNGDMLFERLISNRTYVNEKNAKRTIVNCDYSTNAEQTIQQMTNNPLFTAFVQLVKSSENI